MTGYTETIAWVLLHFVWQGSVLAVLGWMLFAALRTARPQVRHLAGCVVLLAMAAAPVWTWVWLRADLPGGVSPSSAFPAMWPAAVAGQTELPAPYDWTQWIVLLWTGGVGLFAVRAVGSYLAVSLRVRAGRSKADGVLEQSALRIAEALDIRRRVRVFVSGRIDVPSVMGAFRPVIVFPASVVAILPVAQLEMILAHELAHVARHDFVVNCLQVLVESVLFYHPAVWWISRRIRHERELCCDDMAVRLSGDAVSYARALVAIEALRGDVRLMPAAGGGDLRRRISRLLHQEDRREPASVTAPLVVLALMIAAAVGVNAMQAPAPSPLPPSAPPAPAVAAAQVPEAVPAPAPPLPPEAGIADEASQSAPAAPADRVAVQLEDLQRLKPRLDEELELKLLAADDAARKEERLRSLRNQLERLNDVLATMKARYTAANPDLQALQSQVDALGQLLRMAGLQRTAGQDEGTRWRQYAADRFGVDSDRGRMYVLQGPPAEIESHPSNGGREVWRYRSGAVEEAEFGGPEYRLRRIRVNGTDMVQAPAKP